MPTTMTEPRELFLHELGDMLYAERLLEKALPKMADEASDSELRKGFEQHLQETRGHIENLERSFDVLGEPAKPEKCLGIDGIKAEHDAFMKEKPSPEICDMFLTGAGARAEHYEIAAYTSLLTAADAMGEKEVAKLLRQNLSEEEAALRKLESTGKRLAQSNSDMAA